MNKSGVSLVGLGNLTKKLEKIAARASGASRGDGVWQVADQITRHGYEYAAKEFPKAQFEGKNDVIVSMHPGQIGGNPWEIDATGTTVLFIEFGTGILWNTTDAHPLAGKFGYYATSWSETHEGWLVEPRILYAKIPGTWPHREPGAKKTTWYEGNPSSKTMYKTAKLMHDDFDEILKVSWRAKRG